MSAIEIIKDGCFTWRPPSSKASTPLPAVQPTLVLGGSSPTAFSLSDVVAISLGRHDNVRLERAAGLDRAYQLLTFTVSSATLVAGGVTFLWDHLPPPFVRPLVGLTVAMLYLAAKAITHCFQATDTQPAIDLAPLSVADGERVLSTAEDANVVGLEILQCLERAHSTNDRARAVSAESGQLAIRTLLVYVWMVIVALMLIVVGSIVKGEIST